MNKGSSGSASWASRLLLLRIAITGVAITGCSDDRVPVAKVSGRIEFADGTPVRSGLVEFLSQHHKTTASGRIGQEGEFVLGTYTENDGAAIGPQQVIVVQMVIDDGTVAHVRDHGDPVPTNYASYDTSPLTATVENVDLNKIVLTVEQ